MHDVFFFFTDVHGCYDLFRTIMDFCVKQDEECTIIFGGDAIDRGPHGYKIMRELLDNPKVVYLKGNHEDMFVKAAQYIKEDYRGFVDKDDIKEYLHACEINMSQYVPVQDALYNGGYQTLYDWMMDGMPMDLVDRVEKLPLTFQHETLDFSHAGGDYCTFKRVNEGEYFGIKVLAIDKETMLWDRVFSGVGWTPNRTCIYGHTPTVYLAEKYYGKDKSLANIHPCAYISTLDDKWNGRKIAMDTGAVNTGRIYVLNCLTMKAYGFRDTDFGNEEIRKHNVEKIEVIQF